MNHLSSLDVSNNITLTALKCYENQLTSLDVSNNTSLKHLLCQKNQLTSLDVSNITSLIQFYCYDNQLSCIKVSQSQLDNIITQHLGNTNYLINWKKDEDAIWALECD